MLKKLKPLIAGKTADEIIAMGSKLKPQIEARKQCLLDQDYPPIIPKPNQFSEKLGVLGTVIISLTNEISKDLKPLLAVLLSVPVLAEIAID